MLSLRTFLSLAVVASLAAADSGEAVEAECTMYCTHTENGLLLEYLTSYCEPYRYVLPKPKMFSKCKRAFNEAVQAQCPRACTGKATNLHIGDMAQQSCKHEKNQTPRPASFEACVTGYKAGARAATDFKSMLHKKAEDAKSGGAADTGIDGAAVEAQDAGEDEAAAADRTAAAAAAAMAAAQAAMAEVAAAEAEAAGAAGEQEAATEAAAADADAAEDELAQARDAARQAYKAEQAKRKAQGAKGTEL
jgi:hypothetical protein